MSDKPLISIILPAYNAAKYLGEAIRSIINQTLSDWELIVVNDGSTDDTSAIVSQFADARIRLINQNNRGVSFSRNIGLSLARGKYLTFIDADDTFPESSLEIRAKFLESNPEVHIVGGSVRIMNSNLTMSMREKRPHYRGRFLPRLLALDDQIISSICYMVRRDAINRKKFDEEMTHCEDILFWLAVAESNDVIYGSVDEFIYNYRVHDESVTTAENAWLNSHFLLIRKLRTLQGINYLMTIRFRLKLLVVLLKWHLKRRKFRDIFKLSELLI